MYGHHRDSVARYSACSVSSGVLVRTQPSRFAIRWTWVSTQMFCLALIRENQHEVRRLAPDAWQRQQLLHRGRRLAPEIADELRACRLDVSRLVSIEADGIDELLNLLHSQRRHRLRRAGLAEQALGRRVGRGVLRSRGQQRRDRHLKRILGARLRDFFDGGQLEAGDGDRQRGA